MYCIISVYGIEYAIFFLIITNIFSELSSIIIFLLCLPNKNISKKDFIPNIEMLYKCDFKKEENPTLFEPNYLKKPEAEEKLNDSQSN